MSCKGFGAKEEKRAHISLFGCIICYKAKLNRTNTIFVRYFIRINRIKCDAILLCVFHVNLMVPHFIASTSFIFFAFVIAIENFAMQLS